MKSPKLILLLGMMFLPALAQAGTIHVQVKGMVCSFCAQGIEKKFKSLPETARVKVSLESKRVDLETKEGADLSDEQIRKLITEAGYDVSKIERQP